MTERDAHSTISEMEDDILAIRRWAGVLNYLGTGTTMIEPGEVWVISNVLHQVGKRLEAQWNEAFQSGGRHP